MSNYFCEKLMEDISSWNVFFIAADEDSMDLALRFHDDLDFLNISSEIIGYGEDYGEIFNEGDCILAISKSGRDDFLMKVVKSARLNGVNVYSFCSNFRSGLALLSDEVFVIKDKENFTLICSKTIDEIIEKLHNNNFQADDEFDDSFLAYGNPDDVAEFVGKVVDIKVKVGDSIEPGDVVCVVEEMKMENEICSDITGVVEEILIKPGDDLFTNSKILKIR